MKNNLIAFMLPVIFGVAACDSPREEAREENRENRDVNVRVEDRRPAPVERDTVFIGVENKEEKSGVEIRVEEGGDFEIKKKGN